jgi:N-acetylglutamate synthase-like GNAT family acetyltransferase
MELPGVTIRRATIDDLEMLRGLWRECRLPEFALEKRFTEFQVATDANGWILASIGLRLVDHHGHVHSAAFRRADLESDLRRLLWDRITALANQHALYRLWTQEHGPFWTEVGFAEAGAGELKQLPVAFGKSIDHWFSLKLRDEPLKMIAAEEQLEAYLELEKLKTERLVRRGQALKLVATIIAGVVFAIVLSALLVLLGRGRRPSRR